MKQVRLVAVLLALFSIIISAQPDQGIRSAMIAQGSANIKVPLLPAVAPSFSVEAWIFPMRMDELQSVIVRRYKNNPADSVYVYSLDLSRQPAEEFPSLVFRITDGNPENEIAVSSGDLKIQFFQWTHVTGVYDGSSLSVFINGQAVGAMPASLAVPPAAELRIGLNILPVVNKRFFGFIDEVKHWITALSSTAIMSGMNGLDSPETIPDLTGYWKFEEENPPALSPVLDYSSYGNNGEYRGGVTVLFSPFYTQGVSEIQVSPQFFDFGIFEEGEANSRPLLITNTGPVTLPGYTTGGGFVLQPSESLERYFSPAVNPDGSFQSAVVISNASESHVFIPAYGTVIPLKRLDVNNIGMRVTRNGRIALPENLPAGLVGGLEWPIGSGKHCLYQAGLWLGAVVNGEPHAGISNHNTDYVAGNVIGGVPANPSDFRFRSYKISRGDNASNNPDYAEWPADLGAPVNPDGTPRLYGDQTIFTIYNDFDPFRHAAVSNIPTIPLGAEIRQIVYAYNRPGPLMNNVYVKFIVTNRSPFNWTNTQAALWSDIDVGDASDDLAGCDPELNLGFTYNGSDYDLVYGNTPPSVALHYLKGPSENNLMTSFAFYNNGQPYPVSDPSNRWEVNNFLNGLMADGNPYVNPLTGQPTLFPVDGNPQNTTGWIDGMYSQPWGWGDRRILISSGPFDVLPGQSFELDFAITVSGGANNIDAVNVMLSDAEAITYAYLNPPPPIYYITSSSNELGTVEPSGQNIVNEGESLTFYFFPNADNQVKDVIVDGQSVGRPNQYTFQDVRNDHTLYVEFGDVIPPVITLKPYAELWPANHKMERFALDEMIAAVNDNIDGLLPISSAVIDSVSSDELPEIKGGDGSTNIDIKIRADCKSVELRAERLGGGNGRVYTIFMSISDASGNTGLAAFKVLVPKSQGKGKTVIDDGPAYVITCSCSSMNFNASDNQSAEIFQNITPTSFSLTNFPNPFNPETNIRYTLPLDCEVRIEIYNTLGQKIETLVSSAKAAGTHEISWDADGYPSGIYFVNFNAHSLLSGVEFREVKKMLLLK